MGTLSNEIYTEAEIAAFDKTAEAANAVLALEELHPMDREEFCHAFHQIQDKILARPGLRMLGWGKKQG